MTMRFRVTVEISDKHTHKPVLVTGGHAAARRLRVRSLPRSPTQPRGRSDGLATFIAVAPLRSRRWKGARICEQLPGFACTKIRRPQVTSMR